METDKQYKEIVIIGSRHFADYRFMADVLCRFCHFDGSLVTTECRGACRLARVWAARNGKSITIVSANWKLYGKAAGPIRSREMFEAVLSDSLVLAFVPSGKQLADCPGTSHEVNVAQRMGFNVPVLSPCVSLPLFGV